LKVYNTSELNNDVESDGKKIFISKRGNDLIRGNDLLWGL